MSIYFPPSKELPTSQIVWTTWKHSGLKFRALHQDCHRPFARPWITGGLQFGFSSTIISVYQAIVLIILKILQRRFGWPSFLPTWILVACLVSWENSPGWPVVFQSHSANPLPGWIFFEKISWSITRKSSWHYLLHSTWMPLVMIYIQPSRRFHGLAKCDSQLPSDSHPKNTWRGGKIEARQRRANWWGTALYKEKDLIMGLYTQTDAK